MRQIYCAFALSACLFAGLMLAGCSPGETHLQSTGAPVKYPPQGSSDFGIKNNPNIPEKNKKAILGGKY